VVLEALPATRATFGSETGTGRDGAQCVLRRRRARV